MSRQNWIARPLVAGLIIAMTAVAVFAVRTALAAYEQARAAQFPPDDPGGVRALQASLRYRPDNAESLRSLAMRLLSTNPQAARRAAERSVRANAVDWQNWYVLGLMQFELGHAQAARDAMLREAESSRGFQAHFQLANLARLQGDMPLFWQQLHVAWEMLIPKEAVYVINEALSAAHGNPEGVVAVLPLDHPQAVGQGIWYLAFRHYYAAAVQGFEELKCNPDQASICRGVAVTLANRLAGAAYGSRGPQADRLAHEAMDVWNRAISRFQLPGPPVSTGTRRLEFVEPWRGPAFAWAPPPLTYVALVPAGGEGAGGRLDVRFDGTQPEQVALTQRLVPVAAGRYRLGFASGKIGGGNTEGLEFLVRLPSGKLLRAAPIELVTGAQTGQVEFQVPAGVPLLEIVLQYQRPPGSVRMNGRGWIGNIQLERITP